ncbi:hypothetical protein GCM10007972_21000 [Iodidimonas muriae]|uniref:DEAD/DEAH box helicase n=1 Tax=Iodidimonas muriae TaxID=261467 RepID=A0ABQ2LEP1_9PROT|nr:DEAD/DEAH box helicase [Iodidimonas muriae]GER07518.1 hypothetical protein JCM17843_18280 [Kordiimonadales bacterium JCM 17843]GGO14165.1 hypothetical protein GCM10007972_21000 [Iodidimonas muriae]
MTNTTFFDLGIAKGIATNLEKLNITSPTPIQAQAIPSLLERRDVLGIAQTGTGKTAAFSLPLVHLLTEEPAALKPGRTRALVLAPTRELAQQISEAIRQFSKGRRISQAVVVGGVPIGRQVRDVSRGLDILIATPGRLLDLINQKHVRLDACNFLVLDEADRMLDMGFINDIRKIVALLPKQRQSLLFSATMPTTIQRFADEILKDPVRVEVTPETITVDRIDQRVHHVAQNEKRAYLTKMLADPDMQRVIVFSRTKHGADRIATQLERAGISAESIHGNKSQGARQRALSSFRNGRARILVATDIAARGIDVDNITHVVNFDLPHEPESYVHRIGRTARAGTQGIAISFCDASEYPLLKDIEHLTKRPLTLAGGTPPALADIPRKAKSGRGGGGRKKTGWRPNTGPSQSRAKPRGPANRRSAPRRAASAH